MKIVAITVLLCREYDLLLPQPERVDQHGEDAAPVHTGSRRYPGKVFSSVADPDPLVRGMDLNPALDPDPDPSIIIQKFLLFFTLFDFLSLKNCVNVPSKSNKQKNKKKN